MTIVANFPFRRLPYRGYDDPSLPVGIWWGSGTVVGDASGGTAQVRFEFAAEGVPVSGDIFNLEQLSVLLSVLANEDGFLTTVGLAPASNLPAFDRIWALELGAIGSGSGNSALSFNRPQLPLFLGTRRGDVDDVALLAVGVDNPTVTDSLSASAMGYIWEARSILAPGGPQRPARSLFGA